MTNKRQVNMSPAREGQWYVRYEPDPATGVSFETGLMPRSEARNLAGIFGGTVHYLRPSEPETKPRRPLWRLLLGIR